MSANNGRKCRNIFGYEFSRIIDHPGYANRCYKRWIYLTKHLPNTGRLKEVDRPKTTTAMCDAYSFPFASLKWNGEFHFVSVVYKTEVKFLVHMKTNIKCNNKQHVEAGLYLIYIVRTCT